MDIKSKSTTSKVEWAPNQFSWALVDREDLSVKLEEIPPGGNSDLHFHKKARQFFFILEGRAEIHIEDQTFQLEKHDGLEIPLSKKHRITNKANNKLFFLLISRPKVQDDDIFKTGKSQE